MAGFLRYLELEVESRDRLALVRAAQLILKVAVYCYTPGKKKELVFSEYGVFPSGFYVSCSERKQTFTVIFLFCMNNYL